MKFTAFFALLIITLSEKLNCNQLDVQLGEGGGFLDSVSWSGGEFGWCSSGLSIAIVIPCYFAMLSSSSERGTEEQTSRAGPFSC